VFGSPIYLNGKLFKVTSSVALALRSLRGTLRNRILWIDAICINQADLCERSQQVLHMCAIYSQASTVIVWLGPEDESSAVAILDLKHKNSLQAVLNSLEASRIYALFNGRSYL
jgi:Heterokaryon incompatibility protein (HET)